MVSTMFSKRRRTGFTLIELLVVMSIIALLATLAVPRYFKHIERTREAVLRENLHQMRDALDKFHGDQGRYPNSLDELVTQKYLRRIPPDPITESPSTWVSVAPTTPGIGRVADVKSGAPGNGRDGTPYNSW
jgi:general secretion pathway protein G